MYLSLISDLEYFQTIEKTLKHKQRPDCFFGYFCCLYFFLLNHGMKNVSLSLYWSLVPGKENGWYETIWKFLNFKTTNLTKGYTEYWLFGLKMQITNNSFQTCYSGVKLSALLATFVFYVITNRWITTYVLKRTSDLFTVIGHDYSFNISI